MMRRQDDSRGKDHSMADRAEASAEDIAAAVQAFLGLEVPPVCRAGVLANLDLLLHHLRTLQRLSPDLPEGPA
jgi:hypothetical protein